MKQCVRTSEPVCEAPWKKPFVHCDIGNECSWSQTTVNRSKESRDCMHLHACKRSPKDVQVPCCAKVLQGMEFTSSQKMRRTEMDFLVKNGPEMKEPGCGLCPQAANPKTSSVRIHPQPQQLWARRRSSSSWRNASRGSMSGCLSWVFGSSSSFVSCRVIADNPEVHETQRCARRCLASSATGCCPTCHGIARDLEAEGQGRERERRDLLGPGLVIADSVSVF